MNRLRLLLLSLGSLCWAFPGTAQTAPSKGLSSDAAMNAVAFALEAGAPGTSGPFNFNGYTNGAATLVVPPGSTVVMNFVNLDGTHGLSGMWIRFKVDPAAKSPSWATSPSG